MIAEILHVILDVLSGRRNLAAHEADALHEKITPGYTAKPVTDDQIAAAMAVLEQAKAQQAAKEPAPAAAPVAAAAEPGV